MIALKRNKIVLIGAGNVATHLGISLQKKGFEIVQVYSRTEESARQLAEKLHAGFTTDSKNILPADVYFFSLPDSVLPGTLKTLPDLPGLFVHTAGSVPMTVFAPFHPRYGVFYPLQTFSKDREIDFRNIPVFIEANNPEDELLLRQIASELSDSVTVLSSEKREYLHLAAVFACNFTNHMYVQASKILEDRNLPRELLLPLIMETAEKIKTLSPLEAQTGPAVRRDKITMERHLNLLENDVLARQIYQLLSRSIVFSSEQQ